MFLLCRLICYHKCFIIASWIIHLQLNNLKFYGIMVLWEKNIISLGSSCEEKMLTLTIYFHYASGAVFSNTMKCRILIKKANKKLKEKEKKSFVALSKNLISKLCLQYLFLVLTSWSTFIIVGIISLVMPRIILSFLSIIRSLWPSYTFIYFSIIFKSVFISNFWINIHAVTLLDYQKVSFGRLSELFKQSMLIQWKGSGWKMESQFEL